MAYKHPIGEDHPFPEVYALAQSEGFDKLEIVNVYDGALIRLFTKSPDMVFKLEGDPGSAMDRQRFDYSIKKSLPKAPPQEMLAAIRAYLAEQAGPDAS